MLEAEVGTCSAYILFGVGFILFLLSSLFIVVDMWVGLLNTCSSIILVYFPVLLRLGS